MKKLLLALAMVLVVAVCANAADTYTTQVGDATGKLVFMQGPFGPGESGNCTLYVDDIVQGSSSYTAISTEDVKFYYAFGLMFIWDGSYLSTYQPMDLVFEKQD